MAQKKSVVKKEYSAFNNFCDNCFMGLDADKRVALIESSLTENIIKVLNDQELCESLKTLFDNNLNISEASRNTFVHRNTLVYRLDKIKKITGLDARKFEDAISLRLFLWLNGKIK